MALVALLAERATSGSEFDPFVIPREKILRFQLFNGANDRDVGNRKNLLQVDDPRDLPLLLHSVNRLNVVLSPFFPVLPADRTVGFASASTVVAALFLSGFGHD